MTRTPASSPVEPGVPVIVGSLVADQRLLSCAIAKSISFAAPRDIRVTYPHEMSRVVAAVERALDARQREAVEEVEKILAAALGVIELAAPAPPKVSDIVAAAGSSNAAFYRYFAGKDELLLAVMERGVALTASYLEQHMAAHDDPAAKVAAWVEGSLVQVGDPRRAARSRAVLNQFAALPDRQITAPIRDLLISPLIAMGFPDPERDADAVFTTVASAIGRHTAAATEPDPAEVRHLVAFCLAAVLSS